MKKIIELLIMFTLILALCSCSSIKNNSATKESADENPKANSKSEYSSNLAVSSALTIDDIKKKYTDSKILNISNLKNNYILVESQYNGSANRFDLYNLKTGAVDSLPTMPEYVVLKKVVSENFFIFESSGKNSESSFVSFPYIMNCVRVSNDIDKQNNFVVINEDEYYDLNRAVMAGSKKNSMLSDININFSGFEVMFKPNSVNDYGFYSDYIDIPPTKASYDLNTNQLTVEIETSLLNKNIKTNVENKVDHYYISSYEITQKDNKTNIIVSLKNNVKYYSIKTQVDGNPYFIIKFSDLRRDPSSY